MQNISEFWNVATALGELEKIERFPSILPDSPPVHEVLGSKVHDTKFAATMNIHGVRRILTLNTGDFARYDVEARHFTALL